MKVYRFNDSHAVPGGQVPVDEVTVRKIHHALGHLQPQPQQVHQTELLKRETQRFGQPATYMYDNKALITKSSENVMLQYENTFIQQQVMEIRSIMRIA